MMTIKYNFTVSLPQRKSVGKEVRKMLTAVNDIQTMG